MWCQSALPTPMGVIAVLCTACKVLHPILGCPIKCISLGSWNLYSTRESTTVSKTEGAWGERWWNGLQRLLKVHISEELQDDTTARYLYPLFHAFSELFSCSCNVGCDLPEGQLVNCWVPELAIYLWTHLCISFHYNGVNPLYTLSTIISWCPMNKQSA